MPSIATQARKLQEAIESGNLIPTAAETLKPPIPVADYPASPNAYSRGPLPAGSVQQPDMQRAWQTGATPQIRLIPTAPLSNPVVGAAAQSQAIVQIAATPPAPAPVPASATDIDLISAINRQVIGSLDSWNQTAQSGGGLIYSSSTITGISVGANDLAVAVAAGVDNTGTTSGGSPGAGWTALITGAYWNVFPSAGSHTVTQNFAGTNYDIAQTLAFFKTNGSTPVFTNRGSGSGGTILVSNTFTPAVGSSLLFINSGGTGHIQTIKDTAGNTNWTIQANIAPSSIDGGFPHATGVQMAYAQNVSSVSTQVTIQVALSAGSWIVYEISNIGISSGTYTFLSSDNTEEVQFSGEANVTATLPSSAFAVGWQTLVSNYNTVATITLTSTASINGLFGIQPIIPPGSSAWIFSDGAGYWVSQTQMSFAGLAGSIVTSQMNFGISASSSTWFRGDGTWQPIDWNVPPGVAGKLAAHYNGLALVSNGLSTTIAKADLLGQTADIGSTSLFSPLSNTGFYRLSYYVVVTQVATTSSTLPDLQITWSDQDSFTSMTFGPVDSTTPSANTLQTYYQGSVVINAISISFGNPIKYQLGVTTHYASSGATPMQYSAHFRLEVL